MPIKKLRRWLSTYIYLTTDDFDEEFLRINVRIIRPNFKRWVCQTWHHEDWHALKAFEAYVAHWPNNMQEWNEWWDLEQRVHADNHELCEGCGLNFEESLDLEMYRSEASIKRDIRRKMFERRNNPKIPSWWNSMEAVNDAMRKAQPRLIRSMQRSIYGVNPIMRRLGEMAENQPLPTPGEKAVWTVHAGDGVIHDAVYDPTFEEWHDMGGDA